MNLWQLNFWLLWLLIFCNGTKASWLPNHIESYNQWEISSSYKIYYLDKINCPFETSCRVHEISNVVPNLMMISFLCKIYSRSTDRVPKIIIGKLCGISRRYHYEAEKFHYVLNCVNSLDKIRQAYDSVRYTVTLQISVSPLDVSSPT